jgi:HD-GYP domain-containing protein (c-di-GMP phosphodiesterase class II)
VLPLALAAQFGFDFLTSAGGVWLALGVRPRGMVGPLLWVFGIDALLAPVALAAAAGAGAHEAAAFLPLPLLVLVGVFARERKERLDSMLELSTAYRGTAFLLGDVIEADDAYTGSHSRDVVELVMEVCTRLGVDARNRRLAELTALLHDVGKIRVPSEIINKPGPLDEEERRIMNMHTIWGEELLSPIGGLLADVGRIVRSCHERHDGLGYPDGLAGAEIPLVARIVCACDAFNAMTTDRSYRTSLGLDAAIDELYRNRGTQFDPLVVDALVAVVRR